MTNDERNLLHLALKRVLIQMLELDLAPEQIGDDEPLFEAGLGVDSVEALALVTAVEQRFGVPIPDEEIGVGLFQDIRSLAQVVERVGGDALVASLHRHGGAAQGRR
jgi:acyl carrier protein